MRRDILKAAQDSARKAASERLLLWQGAAWHPTPKEAPRVSLRGRAPAALVVVEEARCASARSVFVVE